MAVQNFENRTTTARFIQVSCYLRRRILKSCSPFSFFQSSFSSSIQRSQHFECSSPLICLIDPKYTRAGLEHYLPRPSIAYIRAGLLLHQQSPVKLSFSTSTTPSSAAMSPFELASTAWNDLLAFQPYRDYQRSQTPIGKRPGDFRLNFTMFGTISAFFTWLSFFRKSLALQGLCVSELFLVLWVVQCLPPGHRAWLQWSLAQEPTPENVGLETLKLHMIMWQRVFASPTERREWNQRCKGSMPIEEVFAGQSRGNREEVMKHWQSLWDLLSGKSDVEMPDAA